MERSCSIATKLSTTKGFFMSCETQISNMENEKSRQFVSLNPIQSTLQNDAFCPCEQWVECYFSSKHLIPIPHWWRDYWPKKKVSCEYWSSTQLSCWIWIFFFQVSLCCCIGSFPSFFISFSLNLIKGLLIAS